MAHEFHRDQSTKKTAPSAPARFILLELHALGPAPKPAFSFFFSFLEVSRGGVPPKSVPTPCLVRPEAPANPGPRPPSPFHVPLQNLPDTAPPNVGFDKKPSKPEHAGSQRPCGRPNPRPQLQGAPQTKAGPFSSHRVTQHPSFSPRHGPSSDKAGPLGSSAPLGSPTCTYVCRASHEHPLERRGRGQSLSRAPKTAKETKGLGPGYSVRPEHGVPFFNFHRSPSSKRLRKLFQAGVSSGIASGPHRTAGPGFSPPETIDV